MTYRTLVIVLLAAGAVPAGVFLALFWVIDRPSRWNQYARLVRDLGVVGFLGHAVPLVLTLIRGLPIPAPTTLTEWVLVVGLRLLAPVFLWRLLWVYLRPRVRGDTPEPGSIPTVRDGS
ncbi:MAG TPA: hypothetical protein VJ966_00680 [Actinomycetes bacterium]|nr:hypothetical protein [Actinomycetes bacterium]